MGKFENLFAMSDNMGMRGMLTMWFSFFTTGFVVLLTDDQQGRVFDSQSRTAPTQSVDKLTTSLSVNQWSKVSSPLRGFT